MFGNDTALMKNYLTKMDKAFKGVLFIISLAELILMIRGFAVFNLEKLKLRLYLYSYIFLLVTSLATLIILCVFGKSEKHINKLISATNIYTFCLILWSAVITCIDCYANGDSGIIVYVVTATAVGILTLTKPPLYIAYLGISGTLLLIFTAYARNWEPYSSGFYINFAVFIMTAIFINAHNYRLSRREFEASLKLKRLSYTDQLTDVYNRRSLEKHISAYTGAGDPFVLVLLDLDNLKAINDTLGHPEGDSALIAISKKLTEHFGEHVYRYGGDEFAVISKLDADTVCTHIDSINREIAVSHKSAELHISAGVYTSSPSEALDSAIRKADRALYEAKNSGKSKWVIYK